MAEDSFAIFGLTMVVVYAASLHVITIRDIRKNRESGNKIIVHTKRNLIIGVGVGILLSTIASLGPISSTFGVKLSWIEVPIIILSYTFIVSLVAVEIVIFQIGLRIKKLPVNENMKSFFAGMLIPMGLILIIHLLLRIDPASLLKNCCV